MGLSEQWTRLQLRTAVRRELLDSNPSRYSWTDRELNNYLQDWQERLQSELLFVYGTASVVVGSATSTLTLSSIANDILFLDDTRWDGRRLSYRSIEEMDHIIRDWRNADAVGVPFIVFQENEDTISLWPPPGKQGTLTLEYPLAFRFSGDSDTSKLPPWTKYSALPYCAMRAYLRQGPNMDLPKAMRYRAIFERELAHLHMTKRAYFPNKYTYLKPGVASEGDIIDSGRVYTVPVPAQAYKHHDQVPSGTVNGVNRMFTLDYRPDPTISLKLWNDGILLKQGVHYELSGSTITFIDPYTPVTGQVLFASYRYRV